MAKSRPEAPTPARPDLNNRTILYIGGRLQAVAHFKRLVEDCNGSFAHHDGGMEESIGRLKSLFGRADAVIFPVDCVSHAALPYPSMVCPSGGALATFSMLRPPRFSTITCWPMPVVSSCASTREPQSLALPVAAVTMRISFDG